MSNLEKRLINIEALVAKIPCPTCREITIMYPSVNCSWCAMRDAMLNEYQEESKDSSDA